MPQGRLRLPVEQQDKLNQLNDRLNPENASVLDTSGEKLFRLIGNLLGVGSPEESLMGVTGPMGVLGKGLGKMKGFANTALGRVDETQGGRHMLGELVDPSVGTSPTSSVRPRNPGLSQYMEELEQIRREATEQAFRQKLPPDAMTDFSGVDQHLYRQEWLAPKLRQIDQMIMDAQKNPDIWHSGPRQAPVDPLAVFNQEPVGDWVAPRLRKPK